MKNVKIAPIYTRITLEITLLQQFFYRKAAVDRFWYFKFPSDFFIALVLFGLVKIIRLAKTAVSCLSLYQIKLGYDRQA